MTRVWTRVVPAFDALVFACVPLFPSFITFTNVAFPGVSVVPLPVALVVLATMAMLALWAVVELLRSPQNPGPTLRPILAWWLAAIVSTIVGLNPRDGIIFDCIFALGIAWHAGILRWWDVPNFARVTCWGIIVSGTLACAAAVAMTLTRVPAAQYAIANGRAVGTFVLPGELAGYCIFFIPFAYALATVARSQALRIASWIGVGCGAIAMVMTFSRTGWIGLACALAFYAAATTRSRRGVAAGAGVVIVAIAAVLLFFNVQHNPSENYTRVSIWQAAAGAIDRMPLFGAGPFGFSHLYPLVRLPDGDATAFHAHSMYLTILAELGVVGFAAFLWTVWTFAAELRRRLVTSPPAARTLALAVAAGIAGSLVQGLIDTVSVIIFGLFLPMLALALAAARTGAVDA